MTITPSDLRQFTGTENWYRHPLNRRLTYTDGVKFFADNAGAYWFLDIVATEVAALAKDQPFISVKIHVLNGEADIVADDGNGNKLWSRHIPFTDCPDGEWPFYVTDNVMLLPTEY